MSETDPLAGPDAMTTEIAGHRFRAASPMTALVVGALVLALLIADAPLAALAHQSVGASGGSVPVWFSAPLGLVGFVVAWQKPGNPLGWVILTIAGFFALAEDASFYVVAVYRLGHGGLPLGWVALLAQPCWAVAIVLVGLAFLLFPDGQLPSPRWRWVLWVYLAVGMLWMGAAFTFTVGAILGHHVHVDSSGNLLTLDHPTGSAAWWGVLQRVLTLLIAASSLVSLGSQMASYRRSSGERRQQLKWLLGGSAVCLIGVILSVTLSSAHGFWGVVSHLGVLGFFALLASMSVAILKYRLYEIDRIISRTLAYALATGLLVGVYAGLVLLATRVLLVHTPVAVAASTLAAAALFTPLRRRVQRSVDRRFNRARYDADQMVAAFAGRLKDAVDLNSVRDDLAGAVQKALEPAHVSVWTNERE